MSKKFERKTFVEKKESPTHEIDVLRKTEIVAEPRSLAIDVGQEMIIVKQTDNPDTIPLLQHHITRGQHMGEVIKGRVIEVMELLMAGHITFSGAYHAARKQALFGHLLNHYKELGIEIPGDWKVT